MVYIDLSIITFFSPLSFRCKVREVGEALEWMRLMLEPGSDVLAEMNRRIAANAAIGVYDGSRNAVAWAKQMAADAM